MYTVTNTTVVKGTVHTCTCIYMYLLTVLTHACSMQHVGEREIEVNYIVYVHVHDVTRVIIVYVTLSC